ncbi:tetratricopeptide repeat protein [Nonlabens antarcticus]|uniref:tetratricopeptide repeat protein n=1 Tax=Nonlabens antarcticus TaxID=392714 RepID=UPI001890F043|nr:tetratricopeptide repeat protein [Nonlabens antarcticus]
MNKLVQYSLVLILVCGVSAFAKAQSPQPNTKAYEAAMGEGLEYASNKEFPKAEASYRKAKALNPQAAEASYNLGNLYYENDKKYNASENYRAAATNTTSKAEKHKAFHNMGNTFMDNKQYSEAVEAYKSALRNDPTDDETRYNLALAKQEKEKQGGGGGGGDDKPDKGDNKDENKNKEGDQDDKSGGDNKGDKEKEGKDKDGDKGEGKDDKKGENQEGKDGDGKPKEQEGKQPQRVEGQMTPQQIRQILEAMNNEEQKIQDKINAKKVKGSKKKTEKDW